jgi:hypothetical protein
MVNDWERKRAFPFALLGSLVGALMGRTVTVDQILDCSWLPKRTGQSVTVTGPDPDDGAAYDPGLKESLKKRTKRLGKYKYAGIRKRDRS